MEVVLKYRRGSKKRGSWRYPLWFQVGLVSSQRELERLRPHLSFISRYNLVIEFGHSVSLQPWMKAPPIDSGAVPHFRAFTHTTTNLCCWDDRMTGLVVEYHLSLDPVVMSEAVLHFSGSRDLERFVSVLHEIQEGLKNYLADWWTRVAPRPLDRINTNRTVTMNFNEDDGPEGLPGLGVDVERRIRIP